MNAADVFCLPSLNEGCPNVLLESLACGTKVVASRVGGVPDIIDTPAALQAPPFAQSLRTISWDENARELFVVLAGEGSTKT